MSFREKWMHQLLLNLMKFQEAENYMLYINSAERSYAESLSLIFQRSVVCMPSSNQEELTLIWFPNTSLTEQCKTFKRREELVLELETDGNLIRSNGRTNDNDCSGQQNMPRRNHLVKISLPKS